MAKAICCDRCGAFEKCRPFTELDVKDSLWMTLQIYDPTRQLPDPTALCPDCTAKFKEFFAHA